MVHARFDTSFCLTQFYRRRFSHGLRSLVRFAIVRLAQFLSSDFSSVCFLDPFRLSSLLLVCSVLNYTYDTIDAFPFHAPSFPSLTLSLFSPECLITGPRVPPHLVRFSLCFLHLVETHHWKFAFPSLSSHPASPAQRGSSDIPFSRSVVERAACWPSVEKKGGPSAPKTTERPPPSGRVKRKRDCQG
jgi:hypothetical protein